jgi:uncharacterized membrane protein YfcA
VLYVLLLAFGALAGVTTVLFGFGGGFVAVPLLYALLTAVHGPGSPVGQAAMHIAVATSTCVMVFGASLATLRQHRAGALPWPLVRPLLLPIAAGAAAGAVAASALSGAWVRWAFIAYLALTLADALLRPGFVHAAGTAMRPLGRRAAGLAGLVIGAIAAFLGVGGSVMTVPLMRRRGASMAAATAMASPLSLPMALAGTAAYVLASRGVHLGAWHAGYVDLQAFAVLTAGSWAGIRLAAPLIGRIPDALHARAYLVLLGLVLLVMVLA